MLNRNSSPSDALANGVLDNLRRINLGANGFNPADGTILCHRFQQPARLYGISFLSVAGNGFDTQLSVTKNGVSIVKDEGLVNTATSLTASEEVDVKFLDANTNGYVDFAGGDVLLAQLSNGASIAVTDFAALDLDLVQG